LFPLLPPPLLFFFFSALATRTDPHSLIGCGWRRARLWSTSRRAARDCRSFIADGPSPLPPLYAYPASGLGIRARYHARSGIRWYRRWGQAQMVWSLFLPPLLSLTVFFLGFPSTAARLAAKPVHRRESKTIRITTGISGQAMTDSRVYEGSSFPSLPIFLLPLSVIGSTARRRPLNRVAIDKRDFRSTAGNGRDRIPFLPSPPSLPSTLDPRCFRGNPAIILGDYDRGDAVRGA